MDSHDSSFGGNSWWIGINCDPVPKLMEASRKLRVEMVYLSEVSEKLIELKYILWDRHHIPSDRADDLQHQVIAFEYLVKEKGQEV